MQSLKKEADVQGIPLHMFLIDNNNPIIQKFLRR